MVSATAIVHEALQALVCESWRVPRTLHKRLLHALNHVACERAQTLRQHCALVGLTDLDHVFQQILTPQFTIALMSDLGAIGLFSQAEVSRLQDAVLGCQALWAENVR